jgi:hypothetical protein
LHGYPVWRIGVLEALVASAYVEGFVHCFEVFSEMLREGKITDSPGFSGKISTY